LDISVLRFTDTKLDFITIVISLDAIGRSYEKLRFVQRPFFKQKDVVSENRFEMIRKE
jgi:hypothetical protein